MASRRPSVPARSGAPFALWVLAAVLGGMLWARNLERGARERRFGRIDTLRTRVEYGSEAYDPLWGRLLAERIAARGPLRSESPEDLTALAGDVATLPFVEAVGEPRVIWPDGLQLPVLLADPVACVALGPHFLAVSSAGVVLPGVWNAPPASGSGFLPVLAPLLEPGSLAAGDTVGEPHAAALSVARSLGEHLADLDLARLGRIVIDASHASEAAPDEQGTVLRLEQGRLVLFGRTPDTDEPGELPVAAKWRSLAEALDLLERDVPFDWDLVDVRWDVPELRPRERPGASTAGALASQ